MKLFEKNEVILLEDVVTYNNNKKNCDLIVTNRRTELKPQSLFSRKILIFHDEIKIYRHKIKLEQEENIVYMQHVNGNIMIKFDNKNKAKEFINAIYKALGIKRKISPKAIAGTVAVGAAVAASFVPGADKVVAKAAPVVGRAVKTAAPIVKEVAVAGAEKIIDKVSEKI
jgi:hypothetical protein